MNPNVVYGRGRNRYRVSIGAPRSSSNGGATSGYLHTLTVAADTWRAAKHYVEHMDPARIWVDYARVLRECHREPTVTEVTDHGGTNPRTYFHVSLWDLEVQDEDDVPDPLSAAYS